MQEIIKTTEIFHFILLNSRFHFFFFFNLNLRTYYIIDQNIYITQSFRHLKCRTTSSAFFHIPPIIFTFLIFYGTNKKISFILFFSFYLKLFFSQLKRDNFWLRYLILRACNMSLWLDLITKLKYKNVEKSKQNKE